MDQRIQWNESFITGDRLFCVYLAEGEDAIREHGRRGGFPVDGVYQVTGAFDPTTAASTVAGAPAQSPVGARRPQREQRPAAGRTKRALSTPGTSSSSAASTIRWPARWGSTS